MFDEAAQRFVEPVRRLVAALEPWHGHPVETKVAVIETTAKRV